MRKQILTLVLITLFYSTGISTIKSQVLIDKPNHNDKCNVILAYKYFEQFLDSGEYTWENYKKLVLDSCPAINRMTESYLQDEIFDIEEYREMISDIDADSLREIIRQVDDNNLREATNLIIKKANERLNLSMEKELDIVYYLFPTRDYQFRVVMGRPTICMAINVGELYGISNIMDILPRAFSHEYGHCLHYQLRPDMKSQLKTWIVEEGIACNVTKMVFENSSIYDALLMMPKRAVDWCMENEELIKTTMRKELEKSNLDVKKKFYMGGVSAENRPAGFPEKTAYYVGYLIIESCLEKASLKEVCALPADSLLTLSGFFD